MSQTHPIRLTVDEIDHQARKFFGARNLGMTLAVDEPNRLRFEDRGGWVEIEMRPDTNNQVRLMISNQGYEQAIQDFRHLLSRQAAAETRAS